MVVAAFVFLFLSRAERGKVYDEIIVPASLALRTCGHAIMLYVVQFSKTTSVPLRLTVA